MPAYSAPGRALIRCRFPLPSGTSIRERPAPPRPPADPGPVGGPACGLVGSHHSTRALEWEDTAVPTIKRGTNIPLGGHAPRVAERVTKRGRLRSGRHGIGCLGRGHLVCRAGVHPNPAPSSIRSQPGPSQARGASTSPDLPALPSNSDQGSATTHASRCSDHGIGVTGPRPGLVTHPLHTRKRNAQQALSLLFNLCCPAWLVLPLLSGVSP